MILFITRDRKHHRSAPVREAVVVRCKNDDYCALPQLKIMAAHVDTDHLSRDIVSQIDVGTLSSGRAIIQIPIDRGLI